MPLTQAVQPQLRQYARREAQEPQLVRHGRLALAHLPRRLLLTETPGLHQARKALGLLDKIKVAPLQILHQRQHPGRLFVDRRHQARRLRQPGHARRAQPPLARDQLIAVFPAAHRQRLQNAVLPDRIRQLLQARRIKDPPRLRRIWPDAAERQIEHPPALQNACPSAHRLSALSFVLSLIVRPARRKTARIRAKRHNLLCREMPGNTKSCVPLLSGPHPRRHAANFSTGRAETVEKSAHFAGKLPVSLQLCYILPLPLAIKRLLRYTDIQ